MTIEKQPTISEVVALDGRESGTFDDREQFVLNYFIARGRKHGVYIIHTNNVTPGELLAAKSMAEAETVLESSGGTVTVTLTAEAEKNMEAEVIQERIDSLYREEQFAFASRLRNAIFPLTLFTGVLFLLAHAIYYLVLYHGVDIGILPVLEDQIRELQREYPQRVFSIQQNLIFLLNGLLVAIPFVWVSRIGPFPRKQRAEDFALAEYLIQRESQV